MAIKPTTTSCHTVDGHSITFTEESFGDKADICRYTVTDNAPIISCFDALFFSSCISILFILQKYHYMSLQTSLYSAVGLLILEIIKKGNTAKEDSVVFFREHGIQLSTVYYYGWTTVRFIDQACVNNIIINEAFYLHRVVFYLVVLVREPESLVVKQRIRRDKEEMEEMSTEPVAMETNMIIVFPNFLPRLNLLLKPYRGSRSLFNRDS